MTREVRLLATLALLRILFIATEHTLRSFAQGLFRCFDSNVKVGHLSAQGPAGLGWLPTFQHSPICQPLDMSHACGTADSFHHHKLVDFHHILQIFEFDHVGGYSQCQELPILSIE
jgi:hypothetical protein